MKVVLAIVFAFLTNFLHAQIEIGGDEPETKVDKKKEYKKMKRDSLSLDGNTSVHFYANYSGTNRVLTVNEGLFGDSLGQRADEIGTNNWSFGLSVSSNLKHGFSWEGGLRYLRNGEAYSFEDIDTMHTYTTTYHYVGLPVKVNYSYGTKLRVSASIGLMPQMFNRYIQDRKWKNSENIETEETFKTTSGYNTVLISALVNLGLHYAYSEKWEIFVQPEYRRQLSSSYTKQDSYKHYATALGFNFGITRNL